MLLLSFSMAFMTLYAQDLESQKHNNIQHMKFMGIEMGGTISSFVANLKDKGFIYDSAASDEQFQLLKGRFAGEDNCMIMVYPNADNNVYLVGVVFPFAETWSRLYSLYSTLKSMLTKKYGIPSSCIEKFDTIYEPLDDFDKLYQTKMQRCNYLTLFNLQEGDIVDKISTSNRDCFVCLMYVDKMASDDERKDAIDDL
jgi:hypothetical protein